VPTKAGSSTYEVSPAARGRRHIPWPLVVAACGVLAYANSFSGSFIFDDHPRILADPAVRRLGECMLRSTRPLVRLTFHLNYRLSGFRAADFHAVNLMFHLFGGLLLYGALRRSALLVRRGMPAKDAAALAGLSAALWVAHPVQTESVTYIVQRAEVMAGFFYLLTMYAFVFSVSDRTGNIRWQVLTVLSCALGMFCKPVMVTAPAAVLLYDRTWAAGSVAKAWRARKGFYLALASTWLIPAVLLSLPNESSLSAGGGVGEITPSIYFGSQPGVIMHYLRLVVWPHPLCLDYAWPVTSGARRVLAGAAVPALLLGLSIWGTGRRSPIGFAGAWFFLLLAPTSSFIPIADLAAEHRLYLALAGPVTAAVLAVYGITEITRGRPRAAVRAAAVCASALLLSLTTFMTRSRNEAYSSPERMWRDIIKARPGNCRARAALIDRLLAEQRYAEAEAAAADLIGLIVQEEKSAREDSARPRAGTAGNYYAVACNQLGTALLGLSRDTEALHCFDEALRADSGSIEARHNKALALMKLGRPHEAEQSLRDVLRRDGSSAKSLAFLGVMLTRESRYGEARECFERALRIAPDLVHAKSALARLLATCPSRDVRDGDLALKLALELCRSVDYRSATALETLAAAYAETGDFEKAEKTARQALQAADGKNAAGIERQIESYRLRKPLRE